MFKTLICLSLISLILVLLRVLSFVHFEFI